MRSWRVVYRLAALLWAEVLLAMLVSSIALAYPLSGWFDHTGAQRAYVLHEQDDAVRNSQYEDQMNTAMNKFASDTRKSLIARHASDAEVRAIDDLILRDDEFTSQQVGFNGVQVETFNAQLASLDAQSDSTRWAVTGVLLAISVALWGAAFAAVAQWRGSRENARLRASVTNLAAELGRLHIAPDGTARPTLTDAIVARLSRIRPRH